MSKELIQSFDIIKKVLMERAEVIEGQNNSTPLIRAISLSFSVFTELFLEYFPPEQRADMFEKFVAQGKYTIYLATKNQKQKEGCENK